MDMEAGRLQNGHHADYATPLAGFTSGELFNIRLANGFPLAFATAFAVGKRLPTQSLIF